MGTMPSGSVEERNKVGLMVLKEVLRIKVELHRN